MGARRDLLRSLSRPPAVRADLIRQMYERTETRELAELLMDLEADPEMYTRVLEVLRDSVDPPHHVEVWYKYRHHWGMPMTPRLWRARCSCGWRGARRLKQSKAWGDAAKHGPAVRR